LVNRDETRPLEFLDVIARLAIGNTETDAQSFEGWVAASILAGETEQADITQLGARADATVLENPVGREDSLEDLVGIKRRSNLHQGFS
jgi:hypothetical protein